MTSPCPELALTEKASTLDDVTLSSTSVTESSSGMSSPTSDSVLPPPQCGWLGWRPGCLQRIYNYKTALLLMCCFAFLQGVVVNGFTPLNTGSLERRFGLTSVQTGWLNSAYDLAAATATVFLSYLADRRHKPRWLMFSAMCFTVGSFIFALPHFIATPYSGGASQMPLCFARTKQPYLNTLPTTDTSCDGKQAVTESPDAYWQQVLLVGQITMGIGGAVIYTVGLSFIDDFSEPTSSGLHVGVTFLSTAVGAAAGYGIGSGLLNINVNFNRPDWPQYEQKKGSDPNYVGAWWIGYVVCSGLFACVALAFSCFDYEMPETSQLKSKRVSETHDVKVSSVKVNSTKSPVISAVVDFLNSFLKLVTNPVLVCVTLALVSHALFSQGTQPFFVKIIENQFHVSESKAGFIVGGIIIIGISSAALGSGYVMKRFEMTVRGTLLMITTFVFLSLVFSLSLLLHCDPEHIAGINVGYEAFGATAAPSLTLPNLNKLTSTCNLGCNCSTIDYRPVCHRPTGIQFFSPCHAGCRGIKRWSRDGELTYTNCSCLDFGEAMDNSDVDSFSLYSGICGASCSQLYPAIVLLFMLLFCGFFTTVPMTAVVMRCVHESDRSMALAFNQSVERFLGNIPGPLLIGRIIDFTCIFRREYCNSSVKGACFTYDSPSLAVRLTALCLGLNSAAFLLYLLAFLLYKPPSGQPLMEYLTELWHWHLKADGPLPTTATMTSMVSGTSIGDANNQSKPSESCCFESANVGSAREEAYVNTAYSSSSLSDSQHSTSKSEIA